MATKRHINDRGASMMEYAILIALIALVAMIAIPSLTEAMNGKISDTVEALNGGNVVGQCTGGGKTPGC